MITTSRPRARRTDPGTSHAAAASVDNITATQFYILTLLQNALTDYELVDLYGELFAYSDENEVPRASESGIRSRRAELVARGLVVDTGERRTMPSGRLAIVWKAAA